MPHRGSRGQTFEYELAYDGKSKDGKPFMHRLISVEKLCRRYDVNKSGVNDKKSGFSADKSPPGRGKALYKSAPCRGIANEELELLKEQKSAKTLKNAHLEASNENSSYRSHDFPPACSDLPTVRGVAAKGKAFKGNGSEKTIEVVE